MGKLAILKHLPENRNQNPLSEGQFGDYFAKARCPCPLVDPAIPVPVMHPKEMIVHSSPIAQWAKNLALSLQWLGSLLWLEFNP